MTKRAHHSVLWLWLFLLPACHLGSPTTISEQFSTATAVVVSIPSSTPSVIPASATPAATNTAEATPTIIASPAPSLTSSATSMATLTATSSPAVTPTPAPLVRTDHYVLSRPIARTSDDLVDWIDRTYPYGGTMFGQREVHIGVEFVNIRHTPVLATADGVVAFAGTDDTQQIGPRLNYYGNVVIVEHPLEDVTGEPVSTIYAHLETIQVEAGQTISTGQRLGTVGDSGIAIGPHLHFEVRVGNAFDYRNTRNPALWIKPYTRYGTLAGHLSRTDGTDFSPGLILVIHSDTIVNRETYVYGDTSVNSDSAWGENFVLPDLPQGDYTVTVQEGNRLYARYDFSIYPQTTTWLEIEIE